MRKIFGSIVVGYFSIGAAIGLTQLGFSKVFEPPCAGMVEHILWDHDDSMASSEHPNSQGFLIRVGIGVAHWLPDLYNELLAGDMSLRDYLLGGYRCAPSVPLPVDLQNKIREHLPLDTFIPGEKDRPVGSRAKALVEEGN